MKKLFLTVIIVILSLSLFSCNSSQENPTQEKKVQVKSDSEGFIEPEPSDWVKYIKPVREYMYYRTKAVLHRDVNILWERFPDLKTNIDEKTSINTEIYEVEQLNKNFTLIDANFTVEGRERIKVKTINKNEAIVLVHGGIGYLREDFEESGGEILIKLFLEHKGNQWTVVKTDEYNQSEYKEWIKNNSR